MITIEPPSRQAAAGGARAAFHSLRKTEMGKFVAAAAQAVGLKGEVHVLLSDDATLRRLNKTFRKKNRATDVLSFPAADGIAGVAGDLAISLETAASQAKEHGHSLREEVRVLLLHGVLHLAGYDHETDKGAMAERETQLRAQLGLPSGLIERVASYAPIPAVKPRKTPPDTREKRGKS